MRARVITVQVQPGKWDEAERLYRALGPLWKEQKGFKGAYLLGDRDASKAISVTFWETMADLEANEASGWYQEQIAKFGATFAGPPVMEHYEVTVEV
jgi:heme-degrading monooxygenase HmoA